MSGASLYIIYLLIRIGNYPLSCWVNYKEDSDSFAVKFGSSVPDFNQACLPVFQASVLPKMLNHFSGVGEDCEI